MGHLHLPRILSSLGGAVIEEGVDDLAPESLVEPTEHYLYNI